MGSIISDYELKNMGKTMLYILFYGGKIIVILKKLKVSPMRLFNNLIYLIIT